MLRFVELPHLVIFISFVCFEYLLVWDTILTIMVTNYLFKDMSLLKRVCDFSKISYVCLNLNSVNKVCI